MVGEIDDVRRKAFNAAAERMRLMSETIERMARELCPVRTGRLRDSISSARESALRYVVVAAAPYSGYVEFGTRRTSPKPFMGPAVKATLRISSG